MMKCRPPTSFTVIFRELKRDLNNTCSKKYQYPVLSMLALSYIIETLLYHLTKLSKFRDHIYVQEKHLEMFAILQLCLVNIVKL